MAEASTSHKTDGINTLEEALIRFGFSDLLRDLDRSLLQVRHRKKSKEEHLQSVKEADRRFLKLSITYHPDRTVHKADLPREEIIEKTHHIQAALNATRSILLALTEVFLKHIDIDYKYDFFSKTAISILLSENERNHLIDELCHRLKKMAEVKTDVVIREIRKFLLKSRKCIEYFLGHDVVNFKRYRDFAVYHLEKCIEGYKILASEYSILERECKDRHVRYMVKKTAEQNSMESYILCRLHLLNKLSLGGDFLILSIRGSTEESKYFVLPFVHCIFILLMCTLVVDRSIRIKNNYPFEPPYYGKKPDLYLTALHLACYCNDISLCREEVERILREKNLMPVNEINAVAAFHDNMKKIDRFWAEEFRIDHYDAGKTCEEQFNDRLKKLTAAVAEVKAVEKDLLEKINQCRI